jgi:hypothetical protein
VISSWPSYGGRQTNLKVTLKELVAHLCPSLDCAVLTSDCKDVFESAHSRKWHESDPLQWARQIAFAAPRDDETIDKYFTAVAPRIRRIKRPDGTVCGRAAIAFGQIEAGVDSVGGLASVSRAVPNFSMDYVGTIEFEPGGPRRNSGPLQNPAEVKAWASEQAQLLAESNINDYEKYLAAMNVAHFGGDPTPIATILINRRPESLADVCDRLAKGENIFAVLGASLGQGPAISMIQYHPHAHYGLGFHGNELEFCETAMEAWSGRRIPDQVYHQIPTSEELAPLCFLSCLDRYAESKGFALQMEPVSDVLFATYRGEASAREKLDVGTELRGGAIKLSLR